MSRTKDVEEPEDVRSFVQTGGKARIETVTGDENTDFYNLNSHCLRVTGIFVVLNISLNVAGQPMDESSEGPLCKLLTANETDAATLWLVFVRKNPDKL